MDQTNQLLSSALNTELTDVSNHVNQAIQEAALDDDFLNTENQELGTQVSQLRNGLNKDRGKALIQQLDAADTQRDRLFKALVYLLKGLIFWNKEGQNKAAEKIYQLIEQHGTGITRLSYEKQNAHMDAIRQAMQEPDMVQAMADAGLTDLWNELVQAQEHFGELYRESAALEAEKDGTPTPTSLRPLVFDKLNALLTYLDVMNRVNHAVYGNVQAEVAELVKAVNEKIKFRLKLRKSTADNSETGDTTETM
ncbi:MAG: DUF6261 family protein [Salinivirgaceae bacterium]